MQSLLGNRSRKPDVTFRSDGRIDIAARVSKMLGLGAGDVIDIGYDSEEYYLYVRAKAAEIVGRHEAQCRPANPAVRNGHYFRAYSTTLCAAILGAAGVTDKAAILAGRVQEVPGLGRAIIILPHSNIIK